MKKPRALNDGTPQWFKDWDATHFKPVEAKTSRNEKLIYLLLAAVVGLNTAGNYFHIELIEFFQNLARIIIGGG